MARRRRSVAVHTSMSDSQLRRRIWSSVVTSDISCRHGDEVIEADSRADLGLVRAPRWCPAAASDPDGESALQSTREVAGSCRAMAGSLAVVVHSDVLIHCELVGEQVYAGGKEAKRAARGSLSACILVNSLRRHKAATGTSREVAIVLQVSPA